MNDTKKIKQAVNDQRGKGLQLMPACENTLRLMEATKKWVDNSRRVKKLVGQSEARF